MCQMNNEKNVEGGKIAQPYALGALESSRMSISWQTGDCHSIQQTNKIKNVLMIYA